MIRIERPEPAPAALHSGQALVDAKIAAHDDDPPRFTTIKGTFAFDDDVYGASEVRELLKTAQRWKCCFCESKIEGTSYGEIEHFRPKAAWRQAPTTKLIRPGYYWLAYSWDNLLWSCKVCNGKHKKHLFPLANPEARDCPGRTIEDETPMLIDPTKCDPRQHIRFRFNRAVPISELGDATITALGLNREPLLEDRNRVLLGLRMAWENVDMASELGRDETVVDAKRMLEHAVLPHSPFSSMAIDLMDRLEREKAARSA